MLQEWAALLSVHQLITVSELSLLLWSLVELVHWGNEFLRSVLLCWVHLSSSIDKWLDLSVLSLNDLSHCLIEEVLCSISSTSTLGSGLALSPELPLVDWYLGSPTVDDWVDLMIDDEIMAVFTMSLLVGWHG